MSQVSSSSTSTTFELKTLREKLNSVAWVQCDIPTCLKWRKIQREEAEKLTDHTPWHCSMNKDEKFNACSVEEEDTEQFDKLAKKAKLSIIKSELKPGLLVWAKTSGYCSWPAIITEDPANGEYCDGNEIEILWYHVEYIGQPRTHGWVRSPSVEIFGMGRFPVHAQAKSKPVFASTTQVKKAKRKKRQQLTFSANSGLKDRTSYKGKLTLQKAHEEALKLIFLSSRARLKTCVFTQPEQMNQEGVNIEPKSEQQKRKGFKKTVGSENASHTAKLSLRSHRERNQNQSSCCHLQNANKHTVFSSRGNNKGQGKRQSVPSDKEKEDQQCVPGNKRVKIKQHIYGKKGKEDRLSAPSNKENQGTLLQTSPLSTKEKSAVKDDSQDLKQYQPELFGKEIYLDLEQSCQEKVKPDLEMYYDFSSSLIDVSKVTRLMADIERYKTHSLQFETDLAKFFSLHGLPDCKAPTWCYMKINLFELFLAVLDRGGFLVVSARHQWSSICQEITHQPSKEGGSQTKAFYKKNLYPYELYFQGKDCSDEVADIERKSRKSKNSLKSPIDENQRNGLDKNDLMKELEELDEFLQSNIEGTLLSECKEMETDSLKESSGSGSLSSPCLLVCGDSPSTLRLLDKAEKCSPVLIDPTVPNFSPRPPLRQLADESRNFTKGDTSLVNSQEWTVHELQLLEHFYHQG